MWKLTLVSLASQAGLLPTELLRPRPCYQQSSCARRLATNRATAPAALLPTELLYPRPWLPRATAPAALLPTEHLRPCYQQSYCALATNRATAPAALLPTELLRPRPCYQQSYCACGFATNRATAPVHSEAQVSRIMRKPTFWFPTWSDTNQAVQLQKMARGLKFQI